MNKKIFFITNMCAHYSIKLYELIAQKADVEYYFTGGEEPYWDKKSKKWEGSFKGEYLKGTFVLPRFRVTPGLFRVLFKKFDILIKTIDDRFALPITFLFAKISRRPFIFWVGLWQHPQTLFHKMSYAVTKIMYRYSDAIVVYGEHIKEYLVSLGVDETKIFCAPHAVDNSCFNKEVSDVDKGQIKLSLGISDQKILLYVGRLELCKGLEYLIEAVSKIQSPKIVIVFIGGGSQRSNLAEKCRALNVQNRFLEFVKNDQLRQYYAVADIFILPSISTKSFKEPWGLVVNEAMNQGCPVIATDAVGAAAGGLVENGGNGFIVPEKSAKDLHRAITEILSDESLRDRMSARSFEIIEHWTQENMALGFIEAINYVKCDGKVAENQR